jgi:hypothetical protein
VGMQPGTKQKRNAYKISKKKISREYNTVEK